MNKRCANPKSRSYKWYGLKGVTVCERWKVFKNFLEDMGEPAEGMTIDRIDTTGNYTKENCRWATTAEQNVNRTSTRLVTIDGETLCVAHMAESKGLSRACVYSRLKSGKSIEEAFRRV